MKLGHHTIANMVTAAFLAKGLIMNAGREIQLVLMDRIMTDQLTQQYATVQVKTMNGIKYAAFRRTFYLMEKIFKKSKQAKILPQLERVF